MKPTEQTCDLQRIDDYLDERLSDALIGEFERHLCACARCRIELQKRSAEPDVWRDVVALLGPDSAPELVLSNNRLLENGGSDSDGQTIDESRNSRLEQYVSSVLDSLAPTDDPEMLGRVGEYEISGVVGVGGMGAVLKGFDKSLRRVVAIKVMAPHLAHSGSARTRFQREARAAAAITHDNVIDIYAVSEAAGLPYLVMPYARGPSLQKRIDEGGPLGVIEVVRIGRQIAAGLSAAHEQGLVHRDIKPANILLSDGIERLWITDFGVARAMDDASMTQTGVIAGTPQYMSPEQARGESVDHRSDLFSLGSVLYTACTGRPPFRSEAAYGILRRITDSDPRPIREINSDIPEWLCIIIARLLAKHPADRFENAGEVVELLDGCLAHLQQPLQVELPPSLRCKPTTDNTRSPLIVENNRSGLELQPARTQAAQPPRRIFPKRGLIMTGSIFLAGLLGVLTMQWTKPTDISGNWTGENWKHVSLASVDEASDWYSGTFIDASGRRGALRLEWSRVQRRFNGRWKVGEAEAGQITLRAGENGTLRGAVSVDPESQLEPDAPRLLEFAWQPAIEEEAQQKFESQPAESPSKRKVPDRQALGHSVSVKSPTKGFIVRVADGIKLGAQVKPGDLIAEMTEPTESASILDRQQQRALQRKSEDAASRIFAAIRDLDAARQICAAIEAQIKTLESARQKNASLLKAGLETQATELQDQSNLDTAIVALKKAQADVVKAETEQQLAHEERQALEREIADLQMKLQQMTRLQILAPVAGKVTYIGTFRQSDIVNEGRVICEVTPDPAQPSAPSENTESTVATPPAPMTIFGLEPTLSSSFQGVSGFGPPSELAKRLRESRRRLAQIESSIEDDNAQLKQTQDQLRSLREKREQAEEDDKRRVLDAQIASIQSMQHAKENAIKPGMAAKKIALAELAEVEHEQMTILKLLQNQLAAAHRQLESKQASRERMALNHKSGISSLDELSRAEEAFVEAESESRQLELLYEFYTNIGRNDAEQKSEEQ